VCTVRALKMHSGRYKVVAGKPLDPGLLREDLAAVDAGCANLDKQIEKPSTLRLPSWSRSTSSTATPPPRSSWSRPRHRRGALGAYRSEVWAQGGAGAESWRHAVLAAAARPTPMRFSIRLDLPSSQKIEAIARTMYGADGVDYSAAAETQIAPIRSSLRQPGRLYGQDPPLALHDPTLLGGLAAPRARPGGPGVVGAGSSPAARRMRTMPGLPSEPNAWKRSTSTPTATSSACSKQPPAPRGLVSPIASCAGGRVE